MPRLAEESTTEVFLVLALVLAFVLAQVSAAGASIGSPDRASGCLLAPAAVPVPVPVPVLFDDAGLLGGGCHRRAAAGHHYHTLAGMAAGARVAPVLNALALLALLLPSLDSQRKVGNG